MECLMRVLTMNPGSASVKLAVVEDGVAVDRAAVEAASVEGARGLLGELVARWGPIDAVGVRFVHGGERAEAVLLDRVEIARLAGLTSLAPLHQPLSLALAELAASVVTGPVVACFDTAFHAALPEPAARYALPRRWVREHGLRRYGFHGLSCAHALRRTAEVLGTDEEALRAVCCHIGSGVSVTAISDGHSVDTSMGFTPLEGAVMATRSGSVDPGLLLYLLRCGVTDVAGLDEALDRSAGLAGMTGTSGDVREVLAARAAGDADAALAIEVYLHRLRREIGAAAASLDRLDALVLTGGVAEHQPTLVAELVAKLGIFGVRAQRDRLDATGDRVVSPDTASVRVLVVTAREDLEIARQTTSVAGSGAQLCRDR
jgi:acetate kinase